MSAHFDGFTDHILCIVDLKEITKPQIVSRWWLPGMNRGSGETPTLGTGRRVALHHMLTAEIRNPAKSGLYVLGFGAWRDGGLTIHDITDPATPRLMAHTNWSPPFPAARTRRCRSRAATSSSLPMKRTPRNARRARSIRGSSICACWINRSQSPRCQRPASATTARTERSGRITCTRTGPAACAARTQSSRPTTTRASGCSTFGMRLRPGKLRTGCRQHQQSSSTRGQTSRSPQKSADVYVSTDGLMYVTDWNAGLNVLEYLG